MKILQYFIGFTIGFLTAFYSSELILWSKSVVEHIKQLFKKDKNEKST